MSSSRGVGLFAAYPGPRFQFVVFLACVYGVLFKMQEIASRLAVTQGLVQTADAPIVFVAGVEQFRVECIL